LQVGFVKRRRKKYSKLGAWRGVASHYALACLLLARAALGLAPVGGGCRMACFGGVSWEPFPDEGGSSMPDFATCLQGTPSIAKDVCDCKWALLSGDEKNIRSWVRGGGWRPIMLLLACCLLGRPLDWHQWAGGAEWHVLEVFPGNRSLMRVGRPCQTLLLACRELQALQRMCAIASGLC
jgi:hypothetical protein